MTRFILTIFVLYLIVVGLNWIVDQATVRDCATRGEARLAGGTTITCSVRRESP